MTNAIQTTTSSLLSKTQLIRIKRQNSEIAQYLRTWASSLVKRTLPPISRQKFDNITFWDKWDCFCSNLRLLLGETQFSHMALL